jgi:transposase InsO family protein
MPTVATTAGRDTGDIADRLLAGTTSPTCSARTSARPGDDGCFLASMVACHAEMVVGYAMDGDCKTPLIEAALRHATARVEFASDAICHSDRGSYTSHEFATTVSRLGLRHSVGRTDICYDDALAESFFGAPKNERVHRSAYLALPENTPDGDVTRCIEF